MVEVMRRLVRRMTTRVSVIIPFYNAKRFLRASCLSVLNEPGVAEVIVVDDGSTDGGSQEIEDLPVLLVKRKKRGYPAIARNEGLKLASGEYLCFLDSDDLLVPNGISWREKFLEENPEIPAVGGLIRKLIGWDARPLTLEVEPDWQVLEQKAPLHLSLNFFQRGGWVAQPLGTTLWRRSHFQELGGFDPSLRVGEDIDFVYRWLNRFPIHLRFLPVLDYRIHDANTSISYEKETWELKPFVQASHHLLLRQFRVRSKAIDPRQKKSQFTIFREPQ